MLLLPSTTAWALDRSTPDRVNNSMQPSGVQAALLVDAASNSSPCCFKSSPDRANFPMLVG